MTTTRRQFLAAAGMAGGAAALLAACGGGDSGSPGGASFTLASRITNSPLLVPGEIRLAMSLIDASSTLQSTGPARLDAQLVDDKGKTLQTVSADRHADGLPQAYWPFRFTLGTPGFYQLVAGDGKGGSFGVFDPAKVQMPRIGSVLAPFDTPTVGDHRGVEPYCSLTPKPCPLHDVTLTQALASGKPVIYMVGTPAHCQTGACSPALEFLVAAHERIGDAVSMVHADVFSDSAGTVFAPAVEQLSLDYEPVLYLCTPGGTVVDRLDGIWDGIEVDARIAALQARST